MDAFVDIGKLFVFIVDLFRLCASLEGEGSSVSVGEAVDIIAFKCSNCMVSSIIAPVEPPYLI